MMNQFSFLFELETVLLKKSFDVLVTLNYFSFFGKFYIYAVTTFDAKTSFTNFQNNLLLERNARFKLLKKIPFFFII